ncbi:unnamed protein product [Chrysodeixis includens]|uniref:Uncharacterized protein n=1 Tax=Chrysodeixis includens TaxID=689277 RepID=A0A9N8KWW0_CHRIL|nr:unnamed protein product [Chrysodeixis includens]
MAKQVRTYQPTYRLNPKKRFDAEKIEKVLKRLVDAELLEIEYSEKIVPDLCLNLSEILRNAVKEENYDRNVQTQDRPKDCEIILTRATDPVVARNPISEDHRTVQIQNIPNECENPKITIKCEPETSPICADTE